MTRWQKPLEYGVSVIALALAVVAGILMARAVWLLLEPTPSVAVSVNWSSGFERNENTGASADALARAVSDSHWFGEPGAQEPQSQPVTLETVPETRLEFELKGVMASQEPTRGSALIARSGRSSEYFRVGDSVFGEARLLEVYGSRVVLERDGERETLTLELSMPNGDARAATSTDEPVSVAPASRDRSVASTDNTPRSRAQDSDSDAGASNDSAASRLEEDIRHAISEVRARAASDPQGLLRQYGLEPTDNGYRVTPRAGILIANGLRPGDRITEINDQPVGNVDQDQALVEAVLQSEQIKITLERSGATYRFYQSLPSF